jgi:hypothetical protein
MDFTPPSTARSSQADSRAVPFPCGTRPGNLAHRRRIRFPLGLDGELVEQVRKLGCLVAQLVDGRGDLVDGNGLFLGGGDVLCCALASAMSETSSTRVTTCCTVSDWFSTTLSISWTLTLTILAPPICPITGSETRWIPTTLWPNPLVSLLSTVARYRLTFTFSRFGILLTRYTYLEEGF